MNFILIINNKKIKIFNISLFFRNKSFLQKPTYIIFINHIMFIKIIYIIILDILFCEIGGLFNKLPILAFFLLEYSLSLVFFNE